MANINVVVLSGNLGQDPELRFTPKGAQVANFSIASNRVWTDRETNEKRQETSWVRCEAWGRLGETANNYLKKGSHVVIQGRLRQDRWEDTQGQQRSMLKVVVTGLELPPKAEAEVSAPFVEEEPIDDDVPF